MVQDRIEREVLIAAPVERVWSVITEAEHIGSWFNDGETKVDLRPGGMMSLTWNDHGTHSILIEKVDPPHLFSWRWDPATSKDPREAASTLVEFMLTPEGDGTRLRVVETGFADLSVSEEDRATAVLHNVEGWAAELPELVEYVERLAG
ncbi:SRPBCC family protein [Actinopolymorpha pittospori]